MTENFNKATLYAICTRQAINIQDSATRHVYTKMNASFKGKMLLIKHHTEDITTDIVLSAISGVNKALYRLKQATEKQQGKQHGVNSEAVAHPGSKEV